MFPTYATRPGDDDILWRSWTTAFTALLVAVALNLSQLLPEYEWPSEDCQVAHLVAERLPEYASSWLPTPKRLPTTRNALFKGLLQVSQYGYTSRNRVARYWAMGFKTRYGPAVTGFLPFEWSGARLTYQRNEKETRYAVIEAVVKNRTWA
jgi:hypothetical protein